MRQEPSGGASVEAILAHYDVGNDFFAAWLDRTMTYSAARWDHPDGGNQTIEDAQLAKLDWHLDHLQTKGGTLLDVGCGWGSLLRRAVETGTAVRCIGLTPSLTQSRWIEERMGELPLEVVTSRWEQTDLGQEFDAIACIGALEHFAGPGLVARERVRLYRRFFDFCHRSLKPGGHMTLQFISWAGPAEQVEDENLPEELFPESALPSIGEVDCALQGLFETAERECRPRDYSLTLAAWVSRMNANRSALIDRHGKQMFKTYSRGFRRFALGFEGGSLGLQRMKLVRV